VARGYGVADVETGAPVDTTTLFQAGSVSKPVAAFGVLRAVDEGLFGLDDDINEILESWALDGDGFTDDHSVTPRMLLAHTSGLGDGFGFPGYDPSDPIPTPVEILDGDELANVGPIFMERSPMSLMEYSGGGYLVMQQALSDARGRPFADLMRETVFEPLGMEDSTFEQPLSAERDRNAARGHSTDGGSMGPKWRVFPEMAAAGLWTTASDLARLVVEIQRAAAGHPDSLLSRASAREMLSPVGVGEYAAGGFAITDWGEGWYFTKGGSTAGFRADILAHVSNGYGAVILTNGERGNDALYEIRRRIQVAYGWDSEADPAPRGYELAHQGPEFDVSEAVLRSYVGEYRMTGETSIVATFEENRLFIQATFRDKLPLFAESEDRFYLDVAPPRVSFTRDEAGEVDAMILLQGGKEHVYPKVD
jgi:CubicO group peptidase (beta-lactamase class C family)